MKMASRKRGPRSSVPVRFEEGGAEEFTGTNFGTADYQDDGDDNVMQILNIMQEFQKKKTQKASTRSAAFQNKKNAIIAEARKEAETMVKEGKAYIEQCKEWIVQLRTQEESADDMLNESMSLWSAHEESIESLLATYPELVEELSPHRAQTINAASEILETHSAAREASLRRLKKSARKHMEAGLESQKLATDATTLIKHYRALLLA